MVILKEKQVSTGVKTSFYQVHQIARGQTYLFAKNLENVFKPSLLLNWTTAILNILALNIHLFIAHS